MQQQTLKNEQTVVQQRNEVRKLVSGMSRDALKREAEKRKVEVGLRDVEEIRQDLEKKLMGQVEVKEEIND